MKKALFLILLILLCSLAFSTSVTRSFNSPIIESSDLYITLTVTLDADDTIIAIEENIPSEFLILDRNGGDSQQANTLQWIETEASGTIIYTYKLNVGNNQGSYNFGGNYVAETDTVEQTTTGDAVITVNALILECTDADWQDTNGACQPGNTLTQTWSQINLICQNGVDHDPLINYPSCNYSAPICDDFNYSDWGDCSAQGNQTRTKLTQGPADCEGGTPILSQSCTYVPTCTISNWQDTNTECQSNNELTTTWEKVTNCENGFQPTSPQTQTCNFNATICDSFTYSSYGECQQISGNTGVKFRTKTGSPSGCRDGNPEDLNASCTFTPPCTDSYWTYELTACDNNTQTKTWRKTADCNGGVPHPTTEQISCTPNSPPTPYCGTDDWDSRIEPSTCPSTGIQTKYWTKNIDCQGGLTKAPEETVTCNSTTQGPDVVCTSFTYSDWENCETDGTQLRTVLTQSPSNCINGSPILTQNCTPSTDHCDGTICGETCFVESGICCNDNWNKNKSSCNLDITKIVTQVNDSNIQEAITLVNQAQDSINNGEIAKGKAQAQLALLNSKLNENPELTTDYEQALLALEEGRYEQSEQLSILALKKIDSGEQPFDLSNPLVQIVLALVILAVVTMLALLLGRKKELRAKHAPKDNTQIEQYPFSKKEDLLAQLKDEFKKD